MTLTQRCGETVINARFNVEDSKQRIDKLKATGHLHRKLSTQ
jgi:hypothetical protein